MPEITQTNLAAYENKRVPEEDIQGKVIRQRQAKQAEALGKYQLEGLKEAKRVRGINKKSEEWFNRNANLLYNNEADPTKIDSQFFNDPDKVSEMYKRYQEEVGGNFQGFQTFVEMGKSQEAKANYRSILMNKDEYETEREWKQALNKQLLGMDDGERTRLFQMIDEDSYAVLNDVYNVDEDEYDKWYEKYGKEIGIGGAITAGLTIAGIARGRWKGRRLGKVTEEVMGKAKIRTGFKADPLYKDFVGDNRRLKQAYIRNELAGPNARPRKEIIKEANQRFKLNDKNFKNWKYDQKLGDGRNKITPDSELKKKLAKERAAGLHKPDKPGVPVAKGKEVQIVDHRGRPMGGGTDDAGRSAQQIKEDFLNRKKGLLPEKGGTGGSGTDPMTGPRSRRAPGSVKEVTPAHIRREALETIPENKVKYYTDNAD